MLFVGVCVGANRGERVGVVRGCHHVVVFDAVLLCAGGGGGRGCVVVVRPALEVRGEIQMPVGAVGALLGHCGQHQFDLGVANWCFGAVGGVDGCWVCDVVCVWGGAFEIGTEVVLGLCIDAGVRVAHHVYVRVCTT